MSVARHDQLGAVEKLPALLQVAALWRRVVTARGVRRGLSVTASKQSICSFRATRRSAFASGSVLVRYPFDGRLFTS
jgi:hypothetical protein